MKTETKLVVVYLASPREWGWLDWTRLDCIEASLKLLDKYVRPTPVIVFHEDYTDEDKERLLKANPRITFEKVDFTGQEEHYRNVRPNERVGTYGYGMMCRFFSGVMQAHPLLEPYTHYMRLDDDSYIVSKVQDSLLDYLCTYDYVYNSLFSDPHQDLYDWTISYLKYNNPDIKIEYREAVPYTNFHIASLALWKHPVIKNYTDAIEAKHGCLAYRWDDAQIGQIVYSIAKQIGLVTGVTPFPYRHNQQCCHTGPHTIHCRDGRNDQYPWGPPLVI